MVLKFKKIINRVLRGVRGEGHKKVVCGVGGEGQAGWVYSDLNQLNLYSWPRCVVRYGAAGVVLLPWCVPEWCSVDGDSQGV